MLGLVTVVTLILGALGQTDLGKVSSEGYPVEIHKVTTEDGYILQLVRIPHGKSSRRRSKGVVFLMHGLPFGSTSFTYLGSKYGIAQTLANVGYDVWMGNARGNTFSRSHISKNPDDPKSNFFDCSLDEISLFDLPAMIDYVLEKTHEPNLHYLGHSFGATTFFILNSLKPEYQSKFASANLINALGYSTKFPNKEAKALCSIVDVIYGITKLINYVELKSTSILTKATEEFFVKTTIPQDIIAGTAVKVVAHYCQIFRDGKFRRFNYGIGNLKKYRRVSPPSFDLTKIRVNTTLHYSVGDATQSETDVLLMVKDMPNARARKIANDTWSHLDFILNPKTKKLVTNDIIESLKNS